MASNKICKDHLGNEYNSIKEMCEKYNITLSMYNNRCSKHWSLEKILTTPKIGKLNTIYKDHLGNEFKSKTEMCDYWGITLSLFNNRKGLSWNIEKILWLNGFSG